MPSPPAFEPRHAAASPQRAATPPLIFIVGPTASGKTEWAVAIANRLNGEIVNIDSRQIYQRLEIGVAKPTPAQRDAVRHHCLDLVPVSERYSLGQYLSTARAAIADIQARGRRPILVGGAGQHMRALREGWQIPPVAPNQALRGQHLYFAFRRGLGALHHHLRQVDPAAADSIPAANLRRVSRALEVYAATGIPISEWQRRRAPADCIVIAPQIDRDELHQRIAVRTHAMFHNGIIEETAQLLREGLPATSPGFASIGYREVIAYLQGEREREDALADVTHQTQRLAHNQYKWFRPSDPAIHWSVDLPWDVLS